MIIVVVGYGRAGKDCFSDFLVKKGFKKYRFSDVLKDIALKEGIDPSKKNLMKIGAEIREQFGAEYIAKKLLEKVEGDNAILVGPRSIEELEYVKARYSNVVVVHIHADEDVRRKRGATKERDEDDKRKGIENVINAADIVIENNGSLKELEEKAELFYRELKFIKIGLKVGLEIHQQLNTSKLFCRCPSVLREDEPDVVVERFQRPVASEMGEFDPAAMTEFRKGVKYTYEAYSDSTCLVELDEEPPMPPNEEAIKTCLTIARLFGMDIVDYAQVMRKTVIDGSNTSGFQRTMLLATGGTVDGCFRKIRLSTLCLEEDAARVISRDDRNVRFRLDRLGIPLVEISTHPDMRTPTDVKRTAERIGLILRLTGKVKRGLGTIRQDLNISVRGGGRVEIKGVQDLNMIGEYVEKEAERQIKLIEIREMLRKKNIKVHEPVDITNLLENTGCKFIKNVIKKGGKVVGIRFEKMKGVFGKKIQGKRRFGSEIADYVRVHSGLGGILHSDELPNYGIGEREVELIREKLGCEDEDAFVIIAGEKNVDVGVRIVKDRVVRALEGVPEETRGPNPDGTTRYLRPLPGPARMYPETDVAPVPAREIAESIRTIPDLPEEKEERITRMGVPKEIAKELVRSKDLPLFERLVSEGADPKFAANLVVNKMKFWKRSGLEVEAIPESDLIKLALGYEVKYSKEALDELVERMCRGESFEEAVKDFELVDEEEIRNVVCRVVEELRAEGKDRFNIIMGRVMKELKGKASGRIVCKVVKDVLGK